MFSLLTSTLLTIVVSLPNPAWALNAKTIIKKVQKNYQNLQSLKADFEQKFEWELVGETQTMAGTLFLMSGNRYRIETDNQIVVTNGETVWTYSKENEQVIIDLLEASEENPLPKDLLFKYSEEYEPHLIREENIAGEKTYLLNLVPKDEDPFIKSMKIWVDAARWLTVKI
ncbi:MAG: outer membrane lipoprotein carrier protein LolA, partial [bacterium]